MTKRTREDENASSSQLEQLPNESFLEICLHLSPSDVGSMCCVSKRFQKLFEETNESYNNIWKTLCQKWGAHELTLRGITEPNWKSLFIKLHKIKHVFNPPLFRLINSSLSLNKHSTSSFVEMLLLERDLLLIKFRTIHKISQKVDQQILIAQDGLI